MFDAQPDWPPCRRIFASASATLKRPSSARWATDPPRGRGRQSCSSGSASRVRLSLKSRILAASQHTRIGVLLTSPAPSAHIRSAAGHLVTEGQCLEATKNEYGSAEH